MPKKKPIELRKNQIRELEHISNSHEAESHIANRARIALAEYKAQTFENNEFRVGRKEVGESWLNRFVTNGADGLRDKQKSGRPAKDSAILDKEILFAPLLEHNLAWSSRSIAKKLGISQSKVSRVWQKAFGMENLKGLDFHFPHAGLHIAAMLTSETGSAILLQHSAEIKSRANRNDFSKTTIKRALQVLLTSSYFAIEKKFENSDKKIDQTKIQEFKNLIDDQIEFSKNENSRNILIISSQKMASILTKENKFLDIYIIDLEKWLSLLSFLGPKISNSTEELIGAQREGQKWAGNSSNLFFWSSSYAFSKRNRITNQGTNDGATPTTTHIVATEIVARLEQDISSGRIRSGDRVTESYLTRHVHASRSYIRDAIKELSSQGILILRPNVGAVIPLPNVEDVVETYASRRALGVLFVRRSCESMKDSQILELENQLNLMLEVSKTGDALATGYQDLIFQNLLASLSGLRQVPFMYSSLTSQLKLFVALMGVRYSYPIPDMCRDNINLLNAIKNKNAKEAIRIWDNKMRDCVQYMITTLNDLNKR